MPAINLSIKLFITEEDPRGKRLTITSYLFVYLYYVFKFNKNHFQRSNVKNLYDRGLLFHSHRNTYRLHLLYICSIHVSNVL